MTPAEESYTANEWKLLRLVYFFKRFLRYLKGSKVEILTNNQILTNFFSKLILKKRETHWLEFLGSIGVPKLTLVKGRVHVLGDALSRTPPQPTNT